ncbi:hypothetical protein [Longimicrobium sp.]|uniref:hypothetical protein n=1 Tax=Longimicrobium sp. TaxID=2029185 RepID=UPI003B3AFC0B
MSRRVILGLALLLACAGCGTARPAAFELGSELAGRLLPGDAPGNRLVWVLQPADYLQCASHAREIRRVQRQAGGGIGLTLLAVGGHPEWARAFVARERLEATVVAVTPDVFRREFGRGPVSALYVVDGTRVRGSFSVVERAEMKQGELSRVLSGVE